MVLNLATPIRQRNLDEYLNLLEVGRGERLPCRIGVAVNY